MVGQMERRYEVIKNAWSTEDVAGYIIVGEDKSLRFEPEKLRHMFDTVTVRTFLNGSPRTLTVDDGLDFVNALGQYWRSGYTVVRLVHE